MIINITTLSNANGLEKILQHLFFHIIEVKINQNFTIAYSFTFTNQSYNIMSAQPSCIWMVILIIQDVVLKPPKYHSLKLYYLTAIKH